MRLKMAIGGLWSRMIISTAANSGTFNSADQWTCVCITWLRAANPLETGLNCYRLLAFCCHDCTVSTAQFLWSGSPPSAMGDQPRSEGRVSPPTAKRAALSGDCDRRLLTGPPARRTRKPCLSVTSVIHSVRPRAHATHCGRDSEKAAPSG